MITAKSSPGFDLPASEWVVSHASKVVPGGRVLDYACGHGRHALWLASQGFNVVAVDKDVEVLEGLAEKARIFSLPIVTQAIDLEENIWKFSDSEYVEAFDGLVATNYLYRPVLLQLPKLLKKQGVLIYETFAVGNEAFGKPSNPNFLLQPNELLSFSSNMKILAYEDLQIQSPKQACIQRICAVPLQSKT